VDTGTCHIPSLPITLGANSQNVLKNIYHPLMMDLISHSQISIRVGEFLGKGNNEQSNDGLDTYGEVHNELFRLIETKCGINRITQEHYGDLFTEERTRPKRIVTPLNEYIRVLYLPFDDSRVLLQKSKIDNRSKFLKHGAFLCASRPLFEHICHCLKHYLEAVKTATTTATTASFYVSIIKRPYLFAVFVGKNGKDLYLVSEYYRYTPYKEIRFLAQPDLVYLDRVTFKERKNKLYLKYHSDFGEALDSGEKISLDELTYFVENAESITRQYHYNMGLRTPFERFSIIPNQKIKIYNKIFQADFPLIS
jgi:hypothetical protein